MAQYKVKSYLVDAIQLLYVATLTIPGTPDTTLTGAVGDWLVTEGEDQYFLTNTEFAAKFQVYTPSV